MSDKPLTTEEEAFLRVQGECAQLRDQMARLRKRVLHEATTAPMSAITRMRLRKAVTSP